MYRFKKELPEKTIFAYGSSITHGSEAFISNLCYVQMAAKILKCDVINKGVEGVCFAEPEVAVAYLDNPEWDIGILEIGINMQSVFDCDIIEQRYRNFMENIAKTGKPVFAPSMYRSFGICFKDPKKHKIQPGKGYD